MYDVIIIGAGPAGMSAGITAAAKKLKTLVVTKTRDKSDVSDSGILSMEVLRGKFEKTLETSPKYLKLQENTEAVNLEKNVVSFSVETKTGTVLYSSAVIVATGKSELLFDLLTYKSALYEIKVDAKMQTNVPGVFAAGEVNDAGEKNVTIAAGEGAKAATAAADFLAKK